MPQRSLPFRLAALAHPRVLATSITLPLEILRAAAQHNQRDVQLHLMTERGGMLPLAEGLSVQTEALDPDLKPDLLLLPAIWRNPRWVLAHHHWQQDYIEQCVAQGSWVCSVGSGSFLLASTGLLDGTQATTHWQWFDEFATQFPRIKLRRDQLITESGRLFCVGSVNSIADLMVYLSGILFSRTTAQTIENQFSPEIRRRFSPSSLAEGGPDHGDEQILDAQVLLRGQLQHAPTVSDLAAAVGLSTRTLNRRFKAALGVGPVAYLKQLRLEEARTLLRQTNLSIGEVGWQVGFKDSSFFGRQFQRHTGMTPRDYRRAVRGKSFSTTAAINTITR